MGCHLNLPGPCEECRACGSGKAAPGTQPLQLLCQDTKCAPNCTYCVPLRRLIGPGPLSMMAYSSHRISIDRALQMCPTGALTLAGLD